VPRVSPQSSCRPTWKDTALSGQPSLYQREEQAQPGAVAHRRVGAARRSPNAGVGARKQKPAGGSLGPRASENVTKPRSAGSRGLHSLNRSFPAGRPLAPRLRPLWVRIPPRRNDCNDSHPQFVSGRPTAWPPGRVLPAVSRHPRPEWKGRGQQADSAGGVLASVAGDGGVAILAWRAVCQSGRRAPGGPDGKCLEPFVAARNGSGRRRQRRTG
jgi:hypothetical protein